MYALTGAGGQLGRLVLKHVLTLVPANEVIAATRDPHQLADVAAQGVRVRRADFADPATLPAAIEGAERLLIISTNATDGRVAGHQAAVDAAVAAGVRHISYTSAPQADPHAANPLAAEHGQTEAALTASGIPWTALRNNGYAEVLKSLIDLLLVGDQLLIPEAQGHHPWVTREDCARAAAGVLAGSWAPLGPLDVTGPEALSFADVARRLSRLSGRTIDTLALPDDDLISRVVEKGIPDTTARFMVGLASNIARKPSLPPTDVVERAAGVKPAPIDGVLQALVAHAA